MIIFRYSSVWLTLGLSAILLGCASNDVLVQRVTELEKQNQALAKQVQELAEIANTDAKKIDFMHFEMGLLRREVLDKERAKLDDSQKEQINKLVKMLEPENANIQEISAKLAPFGKGAVVALAEAMRTPNVKYRGRLETSLQLMPIQDVIQVLSIDLRDNTLKFSAARVLGNIQDSSVVQLLAQALLDADENFAFVIAESLIKLKDKRGIPALIEALKSSDQSIRALAINLLSKITNGQTFDYKHYTSANEQQFAIKKWNDWWLKEAANFTFP